MTDTLTPEELREIEETNNVRMNAYYFGFDQTDIAPVNKILSAVAAAGKGFHSTEYWCEKLEYMDNKSYCDLIQQAANEAANVINKLLAHIRVLENRIKELEVALKDLEDVNWKNVDLTRRIKELERKLEQVKEVVSNHTEDLIKTAVIIESEPDLKDCFSGTSAELRKAAKELQAIINGD